VIERDLKGQKYDPKKHHIDHVWPYSRGGSSTEDNLRVLDKGENLKKGSKKPRIKDLF
jgi:5-methylcytosine-specific restriction endonuclease McrA